MRPNLVARGEEHDVNILGGWWSLAKDEDHLW